MFHKIYLFALLLIGFSDISQASYLPEEIRLGALKHDVRSSFRHHYEKGVDINAEFLWASPDLEALRFIFAPRPHIGTSMNTDGGTHQFYFGLTWHVDLF